MNEVALHVPDMSCRHCLRTVTARLRDLPGVDMVEANAMTARLVVHGCVSERDVRAALTEVGFPASDDDLASD